ncbi:hypothetical protein CYLTODRAFT_374758 [Cylindrobasidium torrendii FP15055 ss-10]|uniref:Peptidase C14 caspase domain-containing protein n=1 Tax=Cylindrobasidium torrendii FP15055 ss-10 TaxID=1314674 RepID=A0A0D7BF22_9AGAR|nr:hypothetical protein CYLTODRAFT_374758 [Cylindrobasidium torrendii FP15055 ss-10]
MKIIKHHRGQARWPFVQRIDDAAAAASSASAEPTARPTEAAPVVEPRARSPVQKLFKIGRPTSPEQDTRPGDSKPTTKAQKLKAAVSMRHPSPGPRTSAPLRAATTLRRKRKPTLASAPARAPGSGAPNKRALLIGIKYQTKGKWSRAAGGLNGPHKDVMQMRKLLIQKYNYDPANITVMLDDGVVPSLQPTRKNILAQIKLFISGGNPGDHFFFLYSGHADQVKNHDNTEEDGMDECLVPLPTEGESETFIRDDTLKAELVEKLPVRAQLIAVFDSCHSASLLDLDHFRCNRVYVPWMSKGRRRSDSVWNRIVRHNAMDSSSDLLVNSTNVYQTKRTSPGSVSGRKTSVLRVGEMQKERQEGYRQARQRSKSKRMSIRSTYHPTPAAPPNTPATIIDESPSPTPPLTPKPMHNRGLSLTTTPIATPPAERPIERQLMSPLELCESPVALWPCDGWCQHNVPRATSHQPHCSALGGPARRDTDTPLVLAFGACKDDQISWEDASGASMSSALVSILSSSPNPTLTELMGNVSREMHRRALDLHIRGKKYKKEWKLYKRRGGKRKNAAAAVVEIDNFQDPQLSSLRPLDMGQRFTP